MGGGRVEKDRGMLLITCPPLLSVSLFGSSLVCPCVSGPALQATVNL